MCSLECPKGIIVTAFIGGISPSSQNGSCVRRRIEENCRAIFSSGGRLRLNDLRLNKSQMPLS